MIYLFHGSDIERVRAKAFEWVAAARAKEPNVAYARLAREELTDSALEDSASAGGLFVQRVLVLIDDPFQTKGKDSADSESDAEFTKSHILDEHLDALAASDNAIVILAPALAPAKAKKLAAKAQKAYVFDRPAARDKERAFNTALVNALAERSREKLWLEIVRALRAGDAPEMLHGVLHWKARDLMQKRSRAWELGEAHRLSLSLIALLQDSRRKNLDLAESLERFALAV